MGGAVIILATLLGYGVSHLVLILLDLSGMVEVTHSRFSLSALLVLFLIAGLGFIGFLDDYTKISKQRSLGLTSVEKLAGQTVVAVVFALLALLVTGDSPRAPASTAISFVRDTGIDLAFAGPVLGVILFIVWANILIAGASNGVNLTDGPASPPPSAREPVSPMKILAGEAFHHRKPKQAPVMAEASTARSSGSRTS